MSQNVNELLGAAQQQGVLSGQSASALAVANIGAQIQGALGMPAEDIDASEVVLVSLLIDDSGSIRFKQNSQVVRDGHNTVVDALKGAKLANDVMIHCRYLNGTVLYPYGLLDNAAEMNSGNYNPNGGTPLYDQTLVLLGAVVAKSQEFMNQGVPVRTVSCIITDGADEHSSSEADDVKKVVDDMLVQETHIVCGLGIPGIDYVDYSQVFRDMGIRDEWILTPSDDPKKIREAFQTVSDSAVAVSQSAQSFTQVALGGGFNVASSTPVAVNP